MTNLTRSQHRLLDLCRMNGGYRPIGSAGATIQVLLLMALVSKDGPHTYVVTEKGRQIPPRVDQEKLLESVVLDYLRDTAQGETATDISTKLGLNPSRVMRSVRRLIRAGVLVRAGSNGGSQRRKVFLVEGAE